MTSTAPRKTSRSAPTRSSPRSMSCSSTKRPSCCPSDEEGSDPLRWVSAGPSRVGAAGLAWWSEIPEDRVPEYEDDLPEAPPAEGVRILGAEEAQAAVDGGPDRARPEEPPRRPRRSAPPDDVQPAARFPLPADRLPGEGPAPVVRPAPPPPVGEPSGPVPLPHWTEPPTGEVPMIADDPGD